MPRGLAELFSPVVTLSTAPSPKSCTRRGSSGPQRGSSEDTEALASTLQMPWDERSILLGDATPPRRGNTSPELMREVTAGETNPVLSQIPASLASEQPPLWLLARAAPDPMAKGRESSEQPPRCGHGAARAQHHHPPCCESTSNASTANFPGPGALAAAHSEIPALLLLITYRVTNNIWKIKICAQPVPARGFQHPAGASPTA